jgi:hypothetical protein
MRNGKKIEQQPKKAYCVECKRFAYMIDPSGTLCRVCHNNKKYGKKKKDCGCG